MKKIIAALAMSASVAAVAGTTQLFNGKDLSGWTSVIDYDVTGGYTAQEPTWAVVDGAIRSTGTPFGYLRTKRSDFGNFKLHVEYRWWRQTKSPNSGIFVLITNESGKFLPTCCENQLCKGSAGDVLGLGGGTFNGIVAPESHPFKLVKNIKKNASSERPDGEWNVVEVEVRDGTMVNRVNGVEQSRVEKLYATKGAIALQAEGGAVEFRNVWIEED